LKSKGRWSSANAEVAPDKRIEFRGDVVEESDGDLMGDGVNIVARLEGVAEPRAICFSEDAYHQVKSRLDLEVSDLGETWLKRRAGARLFAPGRGCGREEALGRRTRKAIRAASAANQPFHRRPRVQQHEPRP
jgi:hypothetical protein